MTKKQSEPSCTTTVYQYSTSKKGMDAIDGLCLAPYLIFLSNRPLEVAEGDQLDIASVFDVAARDYDATRRKYISCFDDFYGVAIEQIPYQKHENFRILDLGAGTGLFSALIKNVFPNSDLTLTDISEEMLSKAKERFSSSENTRYVAHDYIADEIHGNFDVVVSALSLHHSTERELGNVFGKIFKCLNVGGVFINADQILGRTRDIETQYEKAWLEQAISKGCTNNEILVAQERMKSDKTLPLSTQLNLLEHAGFERVNCWYQYYRYAVYSGLKTSNSAFERDAPKAARPSI